MYPLLLWERVRERGVNLSPGAFAKQLRRNMTNAELLLWRYLRGHRLGGAKFKRQQPLGKYIVDFVCFEAKLVIELDGGQHFDSAQDRLRDDWLRGQGYEVLRFWNNDVLGQTELVLERILQTLPPSGETSSHSTRLPQPDSQVAGYPQPLSHGGRGDKSQERMRWRCRRGLLELDLVLGRFVERYAGLDEQQKVVFDELLDLPDTLLWDMISGKTAAVENRQRALLELINAA